MQLTYDPDADAVYVTVGRSDRVAAAERTEDVSRGGQCERGIGYDADGRVLGHELLNVSRGLDLTGLPHRSELTALFEGVRRVRMLEAP